MAGGTIGDLLVELGIKKDAKSFKGAEESVKKVAQTAKKLLATVGIGFSIGKIVQFLKQTEAIKKSIEDVKTQWKAVWETFDKTTGTTQVIANWIKKLSNYLLSLVRKVEPIIKNIMKALGGTENFLKSIFAIVVAISGVKALDSALGLGLSKSKIGILVTALYGLYLVIEDIVGFMQGKKSFLGYLCKKYGIDVEKLRDKIKKVVDNVKTFITDKFGKIKETLGKVFQKIGEAAEKAFVFIKDFWERDGKNIAENLKNAWDKLKESFDRIKTALEPFIENVKTAVEELFGFDASKDTIETIGDVLEKVSGALTPIIEKVADITVKVAEFLGKLKPETIETAIKVIAGLLIGMKINKSVTGFLDGLGGKAKTISDFASKLGKMKDSGGLLSAAFGKLKNVPTFFKSIGSAAKAVFSLIGVKGLVIIAVIGAIIAIVVLLIKNWDKIKPALQKAWNAVKSWVTNVKDKISELKDKIVEKFRNLKEKVKAGFQNVKDFIKEHIVLIIGIITGPLGALIAYIVKHRDEIAQKIAELKEKIVEKVQQIKEKITEIWTNIKESVKEKIAGLKSDIVGKWQEIADWFAGLKESALTWGRDLIQGFIDGINEKFEALKAKASEVAGAVKDFLGFSEPDKGPLSNFHTFAPDMMNLFIKGINDNLPALKSTIEGVASAIGVGVESENVVDKTANLAVGASSQNVITQNNSWNNTFNGNTSSEFSQSVTAQEKEAASALGNQLAYLR